MHTINHLSTDKVLISDTDRSSMAERLLDLFGPTWHMSQQSIDFFCLLSTENTELFANLLQQLQDLCKKEGRSLSLQAAHVDSVIAYWCKLQELPSDIFALLDAYLTRNQLDVQKKIRKPIQTIIQDLRVEHARHFITQAEQHHLQHHTQYHFLEVKIRTMTLLKQLNLFNTNSLSDVFFREIISFIVEFHDYEQKERGEYASTEQVTAKCVATWLIDALDLKQYAPELIPVIRVCADCVIELGTTMIWGPNSTMDLMELFFLFDNTAFQAKIGVNSIADNPFLALLSVISLIIGLSDKNPAASHYLMEQEASQTQTLASLKDTSQSFLIIEQFLNKNLIRTVSPEISQQIWLTTWPPHFNMRLELSLADPALSSSAIRLSDMLKDYQKKYISGMSNERLSEWLDNENSLNLLQALIEQLFFTKREKNIVTDGVQTKVFASGMIGEIKFSSSQVDTVLFCRNKIPQLLHQWDGRNEATAADSLGIDSNVPFLDALNLEALENFYFTCSPEEQAQLCKELIALSGRQMGTFYASQPELTYQLPQPPLTNRRPCCGDAFSKLLERIWSCRSNAAAIMPEPEMHGNSSITKSLHQSSRG